jgi:hypothetical protein
MPITDRAIDQSFSDLKGICGGTRNDYFGLLYIMQEFGVEREVAIEQVAFGGNDYGIDGFHFDALKRNLYLFQFKWSTSYEQFKLSFKRLTAVARRAATFLQHRVIFTDQEAAGHHSPEFGRR